MKGKSNELGQSAVSLGQLQEDKKGFQRISALVKERMGIDLPETTKNLTLVATRIQKILLKRGLSTYAEFLDLLNKGGQKEWEEFVSAMTTNTSHFFREEAHFAHLKKVLPQLIQTKNARRDANELRVWCAAASAGQEPYTILMTILESGALPSGWTIKFLATDIDLGVLAKASHGVYRANEVEGVPRPLLDKYFDKKSVEGGEYIYRFKKQYGSLIRFSRLNLIENWPLTNKFDVIFCRNVLIYFDAPTAATTIERLASQLTEKGLFYIGHSESGHVRTGLLKHLVAAAYERAPADAMSAKKRGAA